MDLLQSVLQFSSPVTRGIYFVRNLGWSKDHTGVQGRQREGNWPLLRIHLRCIRGNSPPCGGRYAVPISIDHSKQRKSRPNPLKTTMKHVVQWHPWLSLGVAILKVTELSSSRSKAIFLFFIWRGEFLKMRCFMGGSSIKETLWSEVSTGILSSQLHCEVFLENFLLFLGLYALFMGVHGLAKDS